jgi:hypothetical protein
MRWVLFDRVKRNAALKKEAKAKGGQSSWAPAFE